MTSPHVSSFLHAPTGTFTHVVWDPVSKRGAIIDSVLDYDAASGAVRTASADKLIAHVRELGLEIDWLLETHIHADHLSAAPYLKEELGGGRIAVGDGIASVQDTWNKRFNFGEALRGDPAAFDHLFADGDRFLLGSLEGRILAAPGHTAIDVVYVIGDAAFVGDTFFMPDYGVARTDFPGGDAAALYRSLNRILELPPQTRLFLCHDYLPAEGRDQRCAETTVADERANVMFAGMDEAAFVAARKARDKDLPPPALLLPSLQVNIRAGRLPPPEDNGVAYLKIPLRKA